MAKIIKFENKPAKGPDNLITSKPWEFRRADWNTRHFIQMRKSFWEEFENQHENEGKMPSHFILKGGMAHTIHGIYMYRNNAERMRDVYYLAGLIDCMINRINPLLRTDLIRDIYKKIGLLKKILNINWYGHLDRVLLPIDPGFFNHVQYEDSLSAAKTMKELYDLIRDGANNMFDILSSKYIFFAPGEGA